MEKILNIISICNWYYLSFVQWSKRQPEELWLSSYQYWPRPRDPTFLPGIQWIPTSIVQPIPTYHSPQNWLGNPPYPRKLLVVTKTKHWTRHRDPTFCQVSSGLRSQWIPTSSAVDTIILSESSKWTWKPTGSPKNTGDDQKQNTGPRYQTFLMDIQWIPFTSHFSNPFLGNLTAKPVNYVNRMIISNDILLRVWVCSLRLPQY